MTRLDPIEYAKECVEGMRWERLNQSHLSFAVRFDYLLRLSNRANGAAMGANACGHYDVARVFHEAADEFVAEAERVLRLRIPEHKKGDDHVPQNL